MGPGAVEDEQDIVQCRKSDAPTTQPDVWRTGPRFRGEAKNQHKRRKAFLQPSRQETGLELEGDSQMGC